MNLLVFLSDIVILSSLMMWIVLLFIILHLQIHRPMLQGMSSVLSQPI